MKIDFKNYKVFSYTEKRIKKTFSEDVVEKYFEVLSYLYQNGYDMNCKAEDEIEEQLWMFNNFEDSEDLEYLKSLSSVESDYEIGKKILIEELYDICNKSKFSRIDVDDPTIVASLARSNWNKIGEVLQQIKDIYSSKDSEIIGALTISGIDVKKMESDINLCIDKYQKGILNITWILFTRLASSIYSTYIRISKVKSERHRTSTYTNINSELYGPGGGYNPNTGEIIASPGSSVYEIKTLYRVKDGEYAKIVLNDYLKENKKYNDENVKRFKDWYNDKEKNVDECRRIFLNCLLNGCLDLLILKHNISFFNDPDGANKETEVKKELVSILNYCEIPKEYLL